MSNGRFWPFAKEAATGLRSAASLYHFQFETAPCALEAKEDGTNKTKGTNGTGLKLRVTADSATTNCKWYYLNTA